MAFSLVRTITVDHTKCGSSDSLAFAVCISGTYSYLATVANGGQCTASSQGTSGPTSGAVTIPFDVQFFSDLACTTLLPFEISSYSPTTGAIEAWVQPTVSGTAKISSSVDTVFYMGVGQASSSDQSTWGANTKGSPWDAHYALILHMGSAGSFQYSDNSPHNVGQFVNHSTVTGTTGLIGGGEGEAASLSGSNYLTGGSIGTLPVNATERTMSAWMKFGNTTQTADIVAYGNNTANQRYGLWYQNDGKLYLETAGRQCTIPWTAQTSSALYLVATSPASANTGNTVMYLNGVNTTTSGGDTFTMSTVNTETKVGGVPTFTSGDIFTGTIDEVRVSTVQRSADWITAEYNNQFAPDKTIYGSSGFYTLAGPITTVNPTNSAATATAYNGTGTGLVTPHAPLPYIVRQAIQRASYY